MSGICYKVAHSPKQREGELGISHSAQKKRPLSRLICVLLGLVAWSLTDGTVSVVQATVNQDFRLWAPVYLTVPLSSSFIGYMEVNPRFGDDVSELDQLILRPAIGYKLNDRFSVWQGYAWVGNYQPSLREEDRLYQQLTYREKFSFVKVVSRTRLEERFIEHTDSAAIRARTLLRGDFPLPNAPEWALVAYDEIFVNLNAVRNGPDSGFDQNRVFLGINREFTKQFNMDVGYQMQAINGNQAGLINQINHIILLQFFINL